MDFYLEAADQKVTVDVKLDGKLEVSGRMVVGVSCWFYISSASASVQPQPHIILNTTVISFPLIQDVLLKYTLCKLTRVKPPKAFCKIYHYSCNFKDHDEGKLSSHISLLTLQH